jgi:hypothetical protein
MSDLNEILENVPFRSNFERDNFLLNKTSGPRLLVAIGEEITRLNLQLNSPGLQEFMKKRILGEVKVLVEKFDSLQAELGATPENIANLIEENEEEYYAEKLARIAAVETLVQETTVENMDLMLNLPVEVFEKAIFKCKSYINVVGKTTREQERKANAEFGKTITQPE